MKTLPSNHLGPSRSRLGPLWIALAALAFSGCAASSSLVNMWKDPTFTGPPMRKMFVIAVKKDPAHERIDRPELGAGRLP